MSDFSQLKPEGMRDILKNELVNLETQLWGRQRDKRKFEALPAPEELRAAKLDGRIIEEARNERNANLARIEYDIEKLEVALQVTRQELEELGPKA